MHIFGYDAFAHVPKENRSEIDPKSRKCVFISYGNTIKGYGLLYPTNYNIIVSRDIIFNEKSMQRKEVQQTPEIMHVEAQMSEDGSEASYQHEE